MDEKIYLEQSGLRVSSTRVVIGNTTYALANITSVSTDKTPPSRGMALMLVLIGIFVLMVSAPMESIFAAIVGALICGIGVWLTISAKPTFHVALGTAAGEKHALASKDQRMVEHIVESINTAIIERG